MPRQNNFDQGEFNFDARGNEDGYRSWLYDLNTQKRAFEERWGIILGRKVSVRLKHYKEPFEGVLQLLSDPNKTRDPKKLRLYIAGKEFSQAEIESMVRLD